jgi:HEAT repeat protein
MVAGVNVRAFPYHDMPAKRDRRKQEGARRVKKGTPPAPKKLDKLIASLIDGLGSKRPTDRKKSREKLVAVGHAAVVPLLHKLEDPVEHVRWEAAKVLQGIADPAAADALVESLEDPSEDVRWVAGEALIGLGWEGVKHVLIALLRKADSNSLCIGAHHVLARFAKRKSGRFLKPVLEGLHGFEPGVHTPLAALTALKSLRKAGPIR